MKMCPVAVILPGAQSAVRFPREGAVQHFDVLKHGTAKLVSRLHSVILNEETGIRRCPVHCC